jgi:hypothetical protein
MPEYDTYGPGDEDSERDPEELIDDPDENVAEDVDDQLGASDTLEGNPGDDPLDTGIIPPDRWSAGQRYGTTLEEERQGEPLDQLLAEEEPDIDPYAVANATENSGGDENDDEDPYEGLAAGESPEPRSGRLVAEDEGAHPSAESDLVARDVGIDAGAASAEEAAVHVLDDEEPPDN